MARALPGWLLCAAASLLALAVVAAAGQPVITDDLWWHLGLGRAFASAGPQLLEDPLLFAAPGPPPVRSWLAELLLYRVLESSGFYGLRSFHAFAVAGILILAWRLLRRVGDSPLLAGCLLALFASASAYRLVQLRPQLFTIAFALLVYRLLLADGRAPGALRIGSAACVSALWANLHAGFPLGIALVAAASVGAVCQALLSAPARRSEELLCAGRLALCALLMAFASFANPDGIHAYASFLSAGGESPELANVVDEWRRFPLFELPSRRGPLPSPLTWTVTWLALLALPCSLLLLRGRDETPPSGTGSRIAVALLGAAAMLFALRFAWLAILPLLLLASLLPRARLRAAPVRWGLAAASVAAAVAFPVVGDWPRISQSLATRAQYALRYPAAKYFGHAVWLLADAELEGNAYTSYSLGGFAGFWLAPRIRTLTNGSLNLAPDALHVNGAIRAREGLEEGESFLALLDRQQIDLFLGTGFPELGADGQTRPFTTSHLENVPGWIPVFRGMRSAVYLRTNARNADNLARIGAYYAAERVPFDPEAGFDPGRVFDEAPQWAVRHGIVPVDMGSLIHRVRRERDPVVAAALLDRIATVYALLGLYERTLAVDERLARLDPAHPGLRRRRLWCLLRLGRTDEAAAIAADYENDGDTFTATYASVARDLDGQSLWPREKHVLLPLLGQAESQRLLQGYVHPEARAIAEDAAARDPAAAGSGTRRP